MIKLRCVAIDDEPLALVLLQQYAARIPGLDFVASFDDALAAVEFIHNHPVDLLFVDINMPDITGLDLVRALKTKPVIVFTTAYKKFAHEGFELDAVDYLLKPIEFSRFNKAIEKALTYINHRNDRGNLSPESIYVHAGYKLHRVILNEIVFIESLEDYITIHLLNGPPVTTQMTLKSIFAKLPATSFLRIHRSYIIAASKIKTASNRKVQLSNGTELPVGDSYARALQELLK